MQQVEDSMKKKFFFQDERQTNFRHCISILMKEQPVKRPLAENHLVENYLVDRHFTNRHLVNVHSI
jgi:hypothetical protein